ncbi:phosphoribosylanthranilate isomerase [soil metagenome]
MSGLIKICGISREEHAEAVAESGADFIGFMFVAESRRRVDPWTARILIERAKAINPAIRGVGVFLDASIGTIRAVHDDAGFDLVQFHGIATAEWLDELSMPAWVTARVDPTHSVDDIEASFIAASVSGHVEAIMLDAYHPAQAGGTGMLADWGAATEIASRHPLILAGGLSPANVANAIAQVRPRGVAVSSSVERDGIKDPDLIAAFVKNARAAFG